MEREGRAALLEGRHDAESLTLLTKLVEAEIPD
jgi:hypothetical protein